MEPTGTASASSSSSASEEEMENQSAEEHIPDAFICCVCLDLLYKPVVLACGHVSCFWCVHRSMSGLRESHCPICRNPYHHFPTICQMLHFLLLKLYPISYKRREKQILEDEKDMGCFSPQLDAVLDASSYNYNVRDSGVEVKQSSTTSSDDKLPPVSGGENSCANMQPLESMPFSKDAAQINQIQLLVETIGQTGDAAVEESNLHNEVPDGLYGKISIADVKCASCNQLLFRPVVLNCGHVYCENCIAGPVNGTLRCLACQSPHPRGSSKVFLDLDHFLEEYFPKDYVLRRHTLQLKQVEFQHEDRIPCSKDASNKIFHLFPRIENFIPWSDHGSRVHYRAGCDSCGMYPIIGDRYRCKDCKEAIGFDLCGDCYNSSSKLPGRFNQQHTPEHRFEIVRTNPIRNTVLRLLRGQLEVVSGTSPLPSDWTSPPENVYVSLADDAGMDGENDSGAPVTSDDIVDNQTDRQSPM